MSLLKGTGAKVIEGIIKGVGYLSVLPVVCIVIYIIFKGVPSISWEFLATNPTDGMRAGGILPAIIGSIYLTIVNLAGIPSIIYGLFGMSLFVIFLQFGSSILSGALTLGIMCLPVIITATREALLAIPKDLREASLALGATKWETTWKIILPTALPGILTGIILSISRAAGETAPIMFTVAAFYLPFLPESVWDQVMALPYHLYVIATQVPNMPDKIMNGTVLVIVVLTVGFNLLGAVLRKKFSSK